MHDEAFKKEELTNEKRRPTCGWENDASKAAVCNVTVAIEVEILSCAPSPHADLQTREESEIQTERTQGVPDRDTPGDELSDPNVPLTLTTELPVDATKLGTMALTLRATRRMGLVLIETFAVALKSRTDTSNAALPIRCGSLITIAESHDHTVEGAADC